MIVKVTQEHIDQATKMWEDSPSLSTYWLSTQCPVALALRDTFSVKFAQATYFTVRVGLFPEDAFSFEKTIPEKAYIWIERFDQHDQVRFPLEPFEFELSLEGVKL